jgi:hypothetical protein
MSANGKAAELVTRAARKANTRKDNSRIGRHAKQVPARSAMNWLLDAATYAHDGDAINARAAAHRGLAALGVA